MHPSRLLLGGLFLILLAACAAPMPAPGVSYDATCHFTVGAISEASASGTVTCDLAPTPTATATATPVPPGNTVTVIQFADPDPTGTSCGHADVQDTWLAEVSPENTWGNCYNVPGAAYKHFIGKLAYVPEGAMGNEYRGLIKFTDLSAIPATATVESAFLTIKQTWCQAGYGDVPPGCSGATFTIEAHQVLTAWDERYARWMEMPVFDPVALSTATVANTMGAELTLDVTQVFRNWLTGAAPNNGVMLIMNPLPVNDFFRGRSHDTVCDPVQGCSGGQGTPPGADAPKITVTWRLP